MQHFASFVRLTDKTINQARAIIGGAGKFPNGFDSQSFTRLSGYDPMKSLVSNTSYHDRVQHGLVTKELYRAATGNNPKQYFRDDSLAQKSQVMPIVQNRQLSPEKKAEVNHTTEAVVRAVANPENISEKYGDYPLNYKAINAYTRKVNTDSERLAARTNARTLRSPDAFTPSDYFPKESDNQKFRDYYIDKMKQNDARREEGKNMVKSYLSKGLGNPISVGDKLREKLQQRKIYSEQFNNPKPFMRDAALKYYETTGLMPR